MPSKLTREEYVTRKAWLDASLRLRACPLHRRGGCGFRSCGYYDRKEPEGIRIPRWYCPTGHTTFSLVPDFAAARTSGTLAEIEDAVARFELEREDGASVEQAAAAVRPDIQRHGAIRWMRRRRAWVSAAIATLIGLRPDLLAGRELTVANVREALGCVSVLERAREIAANNLRHMPAPLGFAPLVHRRLVSSRRRAHTAGCDPPARVR